MTFPITATIVGAVLAYVLGALWYSPLLFANRWLAAMQATHPDFKPEPKPSIFVCTGITWIVSSVMFASLVVMTGYSGLPALMCIAVVVWIGFSLPPIVMTLLFEDRSFTVAWISAAYHLAAYVLMGTGHWLLSFFA